MSVPYLRDANHELLKEYTSRLDEVTYRRAKHIISENMRVLKAAIVMQDGDAKALGKLMHESHLSLRDDFEVSGPALNTMVDIAMKNSSCLGARMTGAGFAGCAVALVEKGEENQFIKDVSAKYTDATGDTPALYVCSPADGTTIRTGSNLTPGKGQ